jgi:hypothetical protein
MENWEYTGPRKLPHMSVRKIADFYPSKWPYPCPEIADFGSPKPELCPVYCGFEVGLAEDFDFGGGRGA